MGERAYFLHKEPAGVNSPAKYFYVYSHWGAGWLWRYVQKMAFEHKPISILDFQAKIREEIAKGEKVQYTDDPNNIIDWDDIIIEAYIIVDAEKDEITLALPFISNYIHGGLQKTFKINGTKWDSLLMYRFLMAYNTMNNIITYEELNGTKKADVIQKIRHLAWSHYEFWNDELIIYEPVEVEE